MVEKAEMVVEGELALVKENMGKKKVQVDMAEKVEMVVKEPMDISNLLMLI